MSHGHVNIGRKHPHQKETQAPARQDLHSALRNEKSGSAKQLKNATDFDAKKMKGNPWRHNGKKEIGLNQMYRAGKEKKRGQGRTYDKVGVQAKNVSLF
jgi:hypothetical protein